MLRHPGRLLAPGEFVPPTAVGFIGRQLDLDGDELTDYAVRSETRHEHLAELRRLYGFRSFSGAAARELVERLRDEAEQAQSNEDLVRGFVEACRDTRTILPATTTIERLCADALVDAERRIEARIAERVPPGLPRDLEHLLEETADAGVTRFVWLRQFEPGSNSADANRLLDASSTSGASRFRKASSTRSLRTASRGCAGRESATSPTGYASSRTTAAARFSRSAPSSGRCSSSTRWWRPTTGSSAERIAKPPGPAKRSSGTRRPQSPFRSPGRARPADEPGSTHRDGETVESRGPREQRMPEQQVSLQELQSRLDRYIHDVENGATVVVSRDGRQVARIIPEADSAEQKRAALKASGAFDWSGRRLKSRRPSVRLRDGGSVSDIIINERR